MDYYTISDDSVLGKIVDTLVVLILGISIGVVLSQAMFSYDGVSGYRSDGGTAVEEPGRVTVDGSQIDLQSGVMLEEN